MKKNKIKRIIDVKKKHPEEKIEEIKEFFKNNKSYNKDLEILHIEVLIPYVEYRKKVLQSILKNCTGVRSSVTYENLAKLAISAINCATKGIPYKNDIKHVWSTNLQRKKRLSTILKRALRFYFIANNCDGLDWRNCSVPPSYWEEVNNEGWEKILSQFNLKQSWNLYIKLIKNYEETDYEVEDGFELITWTSELNLDDLDFKRRRVFIYIPQMRLGSLTDG
ncbi:hypothetical protein RhiirA5_383276 [Rhizophagus irregularis]|uniref:Uncharacterized protein n=1 Tax=Rhizophagus irregularis TaxID=588596 RepID=A0A2N0NXM2_9GLOM|nr:hypothetical protein RhiirA5_383276 [Rhizophagus irregularis]